MLINSAQRMPSIGRRISIEVEDLARRLSANILGSYMWRYRSKFHQNHMDGLAMKCLCSVVGSPLVLPLKMLFPHARLLYE